MPARDVTETTMTEARRRDRGWAVALVAAAVALLVLAPRAHATTITSCSDSSLRSAVAAGGTVAFGVDCTDLVLSRTITIPAGLTVDIQANRHTVALDGGNAVRHFVVKGGTLSITGLTLENGL